MRKSPCRWISRDEIGRPSCVHGPAIKNGPKWICRSVSAHKNVRRIRMDAGGISFYLGHAPTVEAVNSLRSKIKKEAPRGTVRIS